MSNKKQCIFKKQHFHSFCTIGKDKDLVIHKHSKISTIIGWISDDKFEELQHVNGNEIVVIQLRGNFDD